MFFFHETEKNWPAGLFEAFVKTIFDVVLVVCARSCRVRFTLLRVHLTYVKKLVLVLVTTTTTAVTVRASLTFVRDSASQ